MEGSIVQDPDRSIPDDVGMLTSHSPVGATGTEDRPTPVVDSPCPLAPPVDPETLASDAVAVVARWLTTAHGDETSTERRQADRMRGIIDDPTGVRFTMRFVDRVARHRRDTLAAEQLARLVADGDLPGFLGRVDRLLLRLGARLAPALPRLVMPLARHRLRGLVGHLVVDAAPGSVHVHLARRRLEGYALNVNLLGEAVLGEAEASRRFERTLALVEDPEVDYVSVKVSAIASQLNLWAFDHTLARVKDRLRILYQRAAVAPAPTGRSTFVNLDMEEHRDLELTLRAFTELLDESDLRDVDAGIVLQAYLPDAFGALQRITAWAGARKDAGGGEVKVRLVKGGQPGHGKGRRRPTRMGAGALRHQGRGGRQLQALRGLGPTARTHAGGPDRASQPQPVRRGLGPPPGRGPWGSRPSRVRDATGDGPRPGPDGAR